MNTINPLDSIYYISLPENFSIQNNAFKIDPTIEIPVQKKDKDGPGQFNPKEITIEQILAGILTVLAYDKKNTHLAYYRDLIFRARPEIKKELCETAILKTKNEDFDFAEEIFRALMGLDPDDPAVILNMALFLDQRGTYYRQAGLFDEADAYDSDASDYYKQVMEMDSPLPDSFFNAGFFYMKQYKFHEAKDAFETYLALTCDVADEDLGENGIYKRERASEIIENIKKQNIDDSRFKVAYDLISSDEVEKGLDEIRTFIEHNPKVWNAWFMLGWGLRKLGRYADAKQSFEQAVQYGAKDNSDTYNEMALCDIQEKDFKSAKENLLKALSLEPESTKIISNLGYLSLAEGKIQEARNYFTTVLEFDPNDRIAAAELLKLEDENKAE